MTSSLPTLGRFCARAIRQTPMISSRHLSSCAGLRLPMSRTLPALNPLQYKVLSVPTRAMSGKGICLHSQLLRVHFCLQFAVAQTRKKNLVSKSEL
jgi:hypothetical protein